TVAFQSRPAALFNPLTAIADSYGNASVTAEAINAATAPYTICALGQSSSLSTCFVLNVDGLRVAPASYVAGTAPVVTVREDGFKPGEVVSLFDDTCPSCLFSDGLATVADTNGTYTTSFVPSSTAAGTHHLRARGNITNTDTFAILSAAQVSVASPGHFVAGQSAPPLVSVRGFPPLHTLTPTSSPP